MTETILSFANNFNGAYGYLALCVFACIENIIPPIPGDMITVFGGYLTGTGRLNLFGVVLSTTTGSFTGFMLMFFLGKYLGRRFFLDKERFFFPKKYFLKTADWFERFGYTVVFFNRFLSGARSVISLLAGITHMSPIRVALYSFVSCFVWNLLLVFAGYKVGENWEVVLELLKKYNAVVMFGFIVLLVAIMLRKQFRRGSGRQL